MEHYNEDSRKFEDEIADLMDLREVFIRFLLLKLKI